MLSFLSYLVAIPVVIMGSRYIYATSKKDIAKIKAMKQKLRGDRHV